MDILAGEKTETTITSSNQRIDQNNKEIASWNNLARAVRNYLNAGRVEDIDGLITTSAVSD